MTKSWQKLSLHAPSLLVETLSDIILDAGAIAITLEACHTSEALFEPPVGTTPLWQHTTIHALFEYSDLSIHALIPLLKTALLPNTLSYQLNTVTEQDWQKSCQDAFQPLFFANKLWVCPSWSPPPLDGNPCVILDPGLAFGTGSHPTTQLCLEWLAHQIKGGEHVIDYGCGSGILALAALKLGARKVWAVDNDPQAIEATLENASRNQIPGNSLEAVLPEDLPANTRGHVLISNILANPLIALAAHFAELLGLYPSDLKELGRRRPHETPQHSQSYVRMSNEGDNDSRTSKAMGITGKIALSGILVEQAASVRQAYLPWMNLSELKCQQEWALLTNTDK